MRRAWWTVCAMLAVGVPGAVRGQAMDDRTVYSYVSFDELEYRAGPEERPVEFDALAWIGGDFSRVWAKGRGERPTRGGGRCHAPPSGRSSTASHPAPEEQARQARQPDLNLPNTKGRFKDRYLLFRRRPGPSVHHELEGHSIDSLKHGRASKSGNRSG